MTSVNGPTPNDAQRPRRVADGASSPDAGDARRISDDRSFGASLGWTVLGTIIPGLGLVRGGRRIIGSILIALWVIVVGGVAGLWVTNRSLLTGVAANGDMLHALAIAMLVIAVFWVISIGATHLVLRPRGAGWGQRAAGAVVVGLLSFAIAAPLALGANVAVATADLLTVFGQTSTTTPTVDAVDPWKNKDRLNVLILGGDSGTGRSLKLGVRPDSVSVLSVDTHTGATSIFNLPRQTAKMPFPPDSKLYKYFPNGFYDGSNPLNQEYALNAIYNNVPHLVPKNILGNPSSLSTDAMKLSVGEALGLKIDYYVLVNMDGFRDIINAIGGITVNVNDRVPIGGKNASGTHPEVKPSGWIEIGPKQHMNGHDALWFARGRYHTTDYKRMARQRCVINAVIQQADPATILTKYQSLTKAAAQTMSTDVPANMLPALADLALNLKGKPIRSILLNQSVGFKTWDPDWDLVRRLVKKTLAEADKGATAKPSANPTATGTGTPTSSATSSPSPTASSTGKEKSANLDDECAYHPNK
ncbi:LCP family protein [Propionicimonas paludicola]|nr:LCP family protein [Propionicimonas paludicola]